MATPITSFDQAADLVRTRIKALRDDLRAGIEAGGVLSIAAETADVGGNVVRDPQVDRLQLKGIVNYQIIPAPAPQ